MRWFELLKALFGTLLEKSDVPVWETELKAMNSGNEEICNALRYINESVGSPPRSDKTNKSSKYTLADLKLWIVMYRKHRANMNFKDGMFCDAFVSRAKYHIQRMLRDNNPVGAALFIGNPCNAADEDVCNDMIQTGGNRGFVGAERKEIDRYCQEIGFSPQKVFDGAQAWSGQLPELDEVEL